MICERFCDNCSYCGEKMMGQIGTYPYCNLIEDFIYRLMSISSKCNFVDDNYELTNDGKQLLMERNL